MAGFVHARLRDLEKQLLVSPPQVRARHADRVEELLASLDAQQDYSYEYVYYRITGFRPANPPLESYSGTELAGDLAMMLDHVSASAPTPAAACGEPVLPVEEAARQMNVTVRTLRRWRRRGFVSRRYIFPDGRARTGVRQGAMERFIEAHRELVEGSGQFSRLSEQERGELARQARRLIREQGLSPTAAAQLIAGRSGRAAETVRRAVQQARGRSGGEEEALPASRGRLKARDKLRIYQAYRAGQPISTLCRHYKRSRASIYRIINGERARELLHPKASQQQFFVEPAFAEPDADERMLVDEDRPVSPPGGQGPLKPRPPQELERLRLRKYNYLKYKADGLRARVNPSRYVSATLLDEIDAALKEARRVKRKLLSSVLPLVVAIARKHSGPLVELPELIVEGTLCAGEAIDKFDYVRGEALEPYARWALLRRFARTVPSENYASGRGPGLPAGGKRSDESTAMVTLRERLDQVLSSLSEEERQAVREHFGMGQGT